MKARIVILVIATIIFVACKKNSNNDNHTFDQMAAKEYYYGVFKKSSEWLGYDRQKNGIKLPDWKNGRYFKLGNSEYVEFPLVKAKTIMGVSPKNNLSGSNASKLANASLSRIIFCKVGNKVTVREIDYIPDWEYLLSTKFDISNNYFAKMEKNFSGKLIFKRWDGKELKESIVSDGKITGKKIERKTNTNSHSAGSLNNLVEENCQDFLVIIYERNCYTVTNGDVVTTECGDWIEIDRWIETVCEADSECEGMTVDECACAMFGCSGDDPEDPNDDPSGLDDQQEEDAIRRIFTEYVEMETTPANIDGSTTPISQNPVSGPLTWEVTKALFGSWSIQAITNYSYIHDRFFTVNMTYIDKYDMTLFTTANSFFIGSNILIESTWTETNKLDQILNNNTENTYGKSNVSGTIRHRLRQPLPVSGGILDVTNSVQGELNFYPR